MTTSSSAGEDTKQNTPKSPTTRANCGRALAVELIELPGMNVREFAPV
jgi:hypothetical protein